MHALQHITQTAAPARVTCGVPTTHIVAGNTVPFGNYIKLDSLVACVIVSGALPYLQPAIAALYMQHPSGISMG
jgi:hypothetical protein